MSPLLPLFPCSLGGLLAWGETAESWHQTQEHLALHSLSLLKGAKLQPTLSLHHIYITPVAFLALNSTSFSLLILATMLGDRQFRHVSCHSWKR